MKRAALFISLALFACSPNPRSPDLTDATIILIVVDTLGAKQVGATQADASATPQLDKIAAFGVSYSQAYSPAPWTQPAVASLFTALMPSQHGVQQIRDELAPEFETLAERLRDRGYSTTGIVSHSLLSAKLGYAQGFDHYDESAVGGHRAITSATVTQLAIDALKQPVEGPRFLFVHYFDPHYYYHHHPEFDRTSTYEGRLSDVEDIWELRDLSPTFDQTEIDYLIGRHREEIAHTDREIGRLIAAADELGNGKQAIVAIVGDHGEEFMEHGWLGHTRTLYNELIRVPLILRLPGQSQATTVDQPVSTLDLMPTLLGLVLPTVELPGPELPLNRQRGSTATPRDVFSEVAFIPPGQPQNAKLAVKTALVRGHLKVVHDRLHDIWELYDLDQDPDETNNLVDDGGLIFRELSRTLLEYETSLPHPETETRTDWGLDADEMQRLQGLGYIRIQRR